MPKFIFILIGFLSFFNIRAQQVTNMIVTQEGDNVVITYDISGNKIGQTFDIKVECSTNNGETFSITPQSLTGDLKEVSNGNRKRIVWDVLSEGQELVGDQFMFQLAVSDYNSGNSGTFTDPRDGHVYKWVKIGTQIWMVENLAYKTNGGSWAYNNDEKNVREYGRLYDWETARNVSPKGWHLPTDAEWTALTNYLGGENLAGGKLKETRTTHWQSPNIGATNETSFAALPGGFCASNGTFDHRGYNGFWWSSSTTKEAGWAWGRYLYHSEGYVDRRYLSLLHAFSLRCLKD